MGQRFGLQFAKDLNVLAGNTLGHNTYEKQVKNTIDFSRHIVIIFPAEIVRISSSFVQGFFDDIVNEIGASGVEEKIEFESSIPDIKEFILENLN